MYHTLTLKVTYCELRLIEECSCISLLFRDGEGFNVLVLGGGGRRSNGVGMGAPLSENKKCLFSRFKEED